MVKWNFQERSGNMVIKILGDCCAHCSKLYSNTLKAIQELNADIKIEQEGDMLKILQYKVMRTPALIINEKIISEGESLPVEKIKALINKELGL